MKNVSRGFTLIELMTAITVLGILFAIAVPSFREFTRNNATTAAQNELVTAFTYARSEALRRGTAVSVCASPPGGTTCSGSADWATGWIAFVDSGATVGTVDTSDTNEVVLQSWGAPNPGMAVDGDTVTYIQYGPTGITSPATAATFKVYPVGCTGAHMRQVGVSAIGSLTSTIQNCPSS